MANPYRAATVIPAPSGSTSAARIAQQRGPQLLHYALTEDTGDLYRWIPGNSETADGFNVLGHSGGTAGRWHRVVPGGNPLGADLTDADVTLTIADGRTQIIPASTLTANRIATLSTAGAKPGDVKRITRLDQEAFTYTVRNGLDDEPIWMFDASTQQWADALYKSAAVGWIQIAAGALL